MKRRRLWILAIVLAFVFVVCLGTLFFRVESDCPWNRYIDTKFSESLNPKNIEIVNLVEIGMSQEDVIHILGKPLAITKLKSKKNYERYNYTSDGAAPFGWDFSWFQVYIYVENGIVVETSIGWVYD
jgi:outer membrane protein assembly factor BamE (lipoprotein component of BamABCDE complex)